MTTPPSDRTDKMLKAVAVYLETKGWSVAVLGPSRIQRQPGAFKFNHEFVIGFTGMKRKKAAVARPKKEKP